ncbi:hypothetical protein KCV07_g4689, partial [Aureobasidium melanogenum]
MDTINTYLTYSLREFLMDNGAEERYEAIAAALENFWMDDQSQFDRATLADLRTHFASWLRTQDTDDEDGFKVLPKVRFRTFLVVDQAVLHMLAGAPDPNAEEADPSAVRAVMIKVVSAQRDERRLPGSTRRGPHNDEDGKVFPGWVNCRMVELRELWEKLSEYRFLYEICPRDFEDEPLWEP